MLKRLATLLCLAVVMALCCGGDGCKCNDTASGSTAGSFVVRYICGAKSTQVHSVDPAQLPDTVEITNADLRLGPPAAAAGLRTASAGYEADFEGATAHRGVIHLTGYYTEEARKVAIFLTTLVPLQGSDSVTMGMQVTFTDDNHAAGTAQYVEDGRTYEGTVELERYPE